VEEVEDNLAVGACKNCVAQCVKVNRLLGVKVWGQAPLQVPCQVLALGKVTRAQEEVVLHGDGVLCGVHHVEAKEVERSDGLLCTLLLLLHASNPLGLQKH
jgi:hypothetical protein